MKRSQALTLAAGVVVIVAISVFLLTRGGDSGSEAATTTSTTSTTTSLAPLTTTAPEPTRVSVPSSQSTAYLTTVGATGSPSGDVVTFKFDNALPGYSVEYIAGPVLSDASGKAVTVAGSSTMKVVLSLASGVKLTGGYGQTYTGPDRITPTGTTVVKEIAKVGDFESVLTWAIGTTSKTPFTVSADQTARTITIQFS